MLKDVAGAGQSLSWTPPDALIPEAYELVARDGTPSSIAKWKAVADGS